MDLLTFLLSDFLETRRGPQNRVADADLAGQELELLLGEEDSAEMELFALDRYGGLTRDERSALGPSVHEWFLERYAYPHVQKRINSEQRAEVTRALVDSYMTATSPTVELLAVNALLASDVEDSWMALQNDHPVAALWGAIVAEQEHPFRMLEELADALFDLYLLSANNRSAFRALRELLHARGEGENAREVREFVETLRAAISARAEALGGEYGQQLRNLTFGGERE